MHTGGWDSREPSENSTLAIKFPYRSRDPQTHNLFFFTYIIYLAGLGLSCGKHDLHCTMRGPSWQCRDSRHSGSVVMAQSKRAGLVIVARSESVGLVVAAHGLSCSAACGILVPQPGIEPASPGLQGGFLTTGPPGKSPKHVMVICY